jgi:hypothetical protein
MPINLIFICNSLSSYSRELQIKIRFIGISGALGIYCCGTIAASCIVQPTTITPLKDDDSIELLDWIPVRFTSGVETSNELSGEKVLWNGKILYATKSPRGY